MKSILYKALPILRLALITGCSITPTTQVSAFAASTQSVSEKVDEVLTAYNETHIERQYVSIAQLYQGKYAPRLPVDDISEIAEPISPEAKKRLASYRANRALGSYASALSILSNAASQNDIDSASASLYGSISGLNAQYKVINNSTDDLFSNEDMALFSTLVSSIGYAIASKKKNDAIKSIVIIADPKVAKICDVLIEELKSAALYDGIYQSKKYIFDEYLEDYKTRAGDMANINNRKELIIDLHAMYEDLASTKLMIQQTQAALSSVKNAHKVLADELTRDRFTSAALAKSIGHLVEVRNHYGDYESFLLTCKKRSKDDKGHLSCDDEISP